MKFQGSNLIPLEPERLWPLLQDANVLRRIIPGCQTLDATGPNEYRLEVRQRLGPFDDVFTGTLHLSEKDFASCLHIIANLESANGLVHVNGDVNLESAEAAATLLRYDGNVELGGRLATVSPRLLETTANAYIRRLLEAIERETAVPQAYPLKREPAAPASIGRSRQNGISVSPWIMSFFGALVGVILLRFLDTRRNGPPRRSTSTDSEARTRQP